MQWHIIRSRGSASHMSLGKLWWGRGNRYSNYAAHYNRSSEIGTAVRLFPLAVSIRDEHRGFQGRHSFQAQKSPAQMFVQHVIDVRISVSKRDHVLSLRA